MICKQEKGFEPAFFDMNTLDDLLNALDKYNTPLMELVFEDDEHGDPRLGIELFDGKLQGEPTVTLICVTPKQVADAGFDIDEIKQGILHWAGDQDV